MLKRMYFDVLDKQRCVSKETDVYKYFSIVMNMMNISRTEGLLSLEDIGLDISSLTKEQFDSLDGEFYQYKANGLDRLLLFMICGVLYGEAPKELKKSAVERYYVSGFQGREALAAYIIIKGLLSIQLGRNPEKLERELVSLLPEEDEDRYIKNKLDFNMLCSTDKVQKDSNK